MIPLFLLGKMTKLLKSLSLVHGTLPKRRDGLSWRVKWKGKEYLCRGISQGQDLTLKRTFCIESENSICLYVENHTLYSAFCVLSTIGNQIAQEII